MGLFALIGSALSLYIWLMTVWDVCRPLSSTSSNPSLGTFSILDLIRSREQDSKTNARKITKRSHTRMETAQREEIRTSLKALFIWLMLKGLEPVFDNSIGYILPLYSLSKAITLLTYVRFRTELSKHLFDSFVLPLGKPNTPLLDLGSFNSIIFPTARFLLSLPFAHLVVALKNHVSPLVQKWAVSGSDEPEIVKESTDSSHLGLGNPPVDRVPPPPAARQRSLSGAKAATSRSISGSNRSASGSGGTASSRRGDGGDGQGGSVVETMQAARRKQSTDSLSDITRLPESSRLNNSTTKSYALLAALPNTPKESPTTLSASSTHPTLLQTFAFIPPATPPSIQVKPTTAADPSQLFTPRMPGFLGGQHPSNGIQASSAFAVQGNSSPLLGGLGDSQSNGNREERVVNGLNKETAIKRRSRENQGLGPTNELESTISVSGTRRKRMIEEAELPPRKVRASPRKSKAQPKTTPSIASSESNLKKSTSTARVTSSSYSSTSIVQPSSIRAPVTRVRRKAT